MDITSTPFIRNDYWPDYNELNELNGRIDEVENELSLTNINLTDKIENVEGNLNAYISQQNNTVVTNNVVVNNINANYATGDFLNFNNVNLDNVYVENLTVNKPVFDITLNTPHIDNITVTGGNIFNTNIVNCEINTDNIIVNNLNVADGFAEKLVTNELIINRNIEPVSSSAVLGYDITGKVIPIRATYDVSFPEDANYLYTDHFGTAFAGTAETEVVASNNLITANAVYNEALNITGNIDNLRNDMNNEFNIVNNTANNLLDNIDYLKNIVESSLLPANITGWNSSTYPVIIQGITEFAVEPLSADYYPISPEADRIRFNGGYYEKTGNNYIKQNVLTYNTYDDSVYVNWSESNKYIKFTKIIKDPATGERHKVAAWKTNSDTIATSGYYLNVDKKPDGTYIVQLLSLTFNGEGSVTSDIDGSHYWGLLYKLPSNFNFQDSVFYYLKNGNNFEGLKVNQGQCTFTTDPATDNNFYIYQKGADWSYPNTMGPEYSILARNNVYDTVYSASSFPLYTGIETMTAYVGDKAKLSVSGTKATLALPGLYWTKANMDMAFYKCSSFNQKMIIQNSVTSMVSTFEGCSSFNQPDMLIYSQNITNMTNAFKECHINNVHIPTSVPKDTSNFMYNCLVNGNTGITFPAANIFNDLQ